MTGKPSALIAPTLDAKLMSDHLRMISVEVRQDAYVVPVLDGTSWHKTKALKVPTSMTLLRLAP